MILIDTNIIVYLLIEGDHTEAAQELRRRDPDWHSEAFLMVEFTNVLAASVAAKRMNLALAQLFLVEDAKLRAAAPALTQSLAEALARV